MGDTQLFTDGGNKVWRLIDSFRSQRLVQADDGRLVVTNLEIASELGIAIEDVKLLKKKLTRA